MCIMFSLAFLECFTLVLAIGHLISPLVFIEVKVIQFLVFSGGTYMKLVIKYQISAINSCWEKCDEKWEYMFNVYKNQQSRQTESRNLMGPKTLPTILWVAFLDPSDSYFLFADLVGFYTHWTYMHIFRHIFLSNYWW
jgi:hypothetical protein